MIVDWYDLISAIPNFIKSGANKVLWMSVPEKYSRLATEKFLINRWKPQLCRPTGYTAVLLKRQRNSTPDTIPSCH